MAKKLLIEKNNLKTEKDDLFRNDWALADNNTISGISWDYPNNNSLD